MPVSKEKAAAVKEQRRRVYELRCAGNVYADIARSEGITEDLARQCVVRAVKRDKLGPMPEELVGERGFFAKADPQQVGAVIARAVVANAGASPRQSDLSKYAALRESLKGAGMKPALINAILARLRTDLAPAMEAGKRFTIAEMLETTERKLPLIAHYIDEFSVSQASLKDLTIAWGILVEKHQLLSNKPTQIVDFRSRATVEVMVPALLAEAKRRGITVDSTAARVPEMPAAVSMVESGITLEFTQGASS